MKNKITKRIIVLALAFIMVFALSACGGGSSSSAPANDELRIGLSGALSSLDNGQEAGILNYYVTAITQDGLVGLSNDGKVVPTLAESWEDEDAKVWTFKIREGVKFYDGRELVADDIVYSIERSMDENVSPGSVMYFPKDNVKSVEAPDDYTVVITLNEPQAGFIQAVSNSGGLFVVNKDFIDSVTTNGSPKDLITGTGPYKPVEFTESYLVLEANENYWGEQPEIKKIRIDFIEDDNTRLLAFKDGSIDFTDKVPVDSSEQWTAIDGASVEGYPNREYNGLTIDPTVAPFDDINVRKAVAYAVDKQSIVDGVLKGHGEVATAIPAPQQFAAVLDTEAATAKLAEVFNYEFSIEKAKEALAASGSADGFDTTLTYPNSYASIGKASLAIAETLKEIGINVEVKEIPLEQWLNEVGNGEQGIGWMIYGATTSEPAEITTWLLDTSAVGANPANWVNEEVAALEQSALKATDYTEQIEFVVEGDSIAQENAIYQPVYWGEAAVGFNKGVSGTDFNSYTLFTNWPSQFKIER
ncbi:MAG: ABC transporter substrate-binding protein [Clostridiales Family XIII bacterium]|jgi:peptide/nickel transport system substrate-binding protein|nr:ABC transporter substrate-binding protein [Clostridiales Family XIII bacterium]